MNKIIKLGLALLVAFIMTGCGNKVATVKPELTQYKGEKVKVYTTMLDMRDGRSISRAYEAGVGATAALERTARATIEAGHTHFAIWAPYRISNYRGSTINTFKEFEEQCIAGFMESATSAFDAFGIGENACGISFAGNQNMAFLNYQMFDAPQDEFLTWDAKQLIADIKEAGEENDAGWEELSRTKKSSWTYQNANTKFGGAHSQWVNAQRVRD